MNCLAAVYNAILSTGLPGLSEHTRTKLQPGHRLSLPQWERTRGRCTTMIRRERQMQGTLPSKAGLQGRRACHRGCWALLLLSAHSLLCSRPRVAHSLLCSRPRVVHIPPLCRMKTWTAWIHAWVQVSQQQGPTAHAWEQIVRQHEASLVWIETASPGCHIQKLPARVGTRCRANANPENLGTGGTDIYRDETD